jgi:hypothetical protein
METKKCSKCGKVKNVTDFFIRMKLKNQFHSQCKECYKDNRDPQGHYKKYRDEYVKRSTDRKIIKTTENRMNLLEYFKTHHCIVCDESNPIVLDFDHREQEDKILNISQMIYHHNWDSILKEIEKCDVLCANHHRIRTSKQLGWWYEHVK